MEHHGTSWNIIEHQCHRGHHGHWGHQGNHGNYSHQGPHGHQGHHGHFFSYQGPQGQLLQICIQFSKRKNYRYWQKCSKSQKVGVDL